MPAHEKVIYFSGTRNPRTSFLSNDSMHRFKLGDKVWPSVTHFIEAAKYKGTQREEEIRNASTVLQAKRLGKEKMGTVVHIVRDDWDVIKSSLMTDAIKAKFGQNVRLQDKLIRTRDAKLIDTTDTDAGPILMEVRNIFRGTPDDDSIVLAEPFDRTDVDERDLPKKYRRFAKLLIKLSYHIADMEGWDILQDGMVEDAIYNACRKKKVGKRAIAYIERVSNELSWSTIYYEMPNFENWMDSVQHLETDVGTVENSKQGTMISIFILWIHRKLSSSKQDAIFERVKGWKKMELRFLRKERWYRANPPRLPGVMRKQHERIKRKKKDKERKVKPKISDRPKRKKKSRPLKVVKYLQPESLSPTATSVFVPVEERAVSPSDITVITPVKDKKPPKHLKIVDIDGGKGFFVWGQTLHRYAAQLLSLGGNYQSRFHAARYVERKDVIQFHGKALSRKRDALLEMGGQYPFRYRGEEVDDMVLELPTQIAKKHESYIGEIEFRSNSDESKYIYDVNTLSEEDIELLKKIGARNPKILDQDKKKNHNVIQFKGDILEKNRSKLERLGGRYPKQQTEAGGTTVDKTKVVFSSNNCRSDVETIILESLEGVDKYIAAYQMWIRDTLTEYIDSLIQILSLIEQRTINESDVKLVVNDIYGCKIPASVSNQPLEYNYGDIIHSIISMRGGSTNYAINDNASSLLSKYIEYQGRCLTRSLQSKPKKAYINFRKRLVSEEEYLSQRAASKCKSQNGLNTDQVCILRAMNHVADCLITNIPALKNNMNQVAKESFLMIFPTEESREGACNYIDEILETLDEGRQTSFTWLEDKLLTKGVKYRLSRVKSSITGKKIVFDNDGLCLSVFAAAIHYTSPRLRGTQYPHIMERVRQMADLSICQEECSSSSMSSLKSDPVILFSSPVDDNGFLSNLYISPFTIDGNSYKSVEHYYQSQKFATVDDDAYKEFSELIRSQPTPTKAAFLGDMRREDAGTGHLWPWQHALSQHIQNARSKGVRLRDDWPVVKETIMLRGLREKFDQNLDLAQQLVDTGDSMLVKHTKQDDDRWWGDGGDQGSGIEGKNKLGQLLIVVREELE